TTDTRAVAPGTGTPVRDIQHIPGAEGGDATIAELRERFRRVAGRRDVDLRYETAGRLFSYDYQVVYDEETAIFRVMLKPGGCFEGAYRFIERWITRRAQQLDGTYAQPPPGYQDCRDD